MPRLCSFATRKRMNRPLGKQAYFPAMQKRTEYRYGQEVVGNWRHSQEELVNDLV